ncbi:MAG: hypothetical protein H6806_03370 [Planctomycetes bacterium]|nr:hypothetical protein [Planctomycetota bacterium]MCB9825269.1 hypothetical protein [Planctomycetota bacterium]MCB9828794.1 hypothetical protein [Planctomycetota bacterium]MCB9900754.1 hypothetical protein [Planctomycetota bacterium]
MVVGTTLFKLDGNAYHSPQFRRGGLAATFTIDLTHVSSANFKVDVEHRNEEDTAFSAAASFSTLTSVGIASLDVGSLKEIIRMRYTFDVGDGASAAVHFLMQAPSWRPY